MEAVFVIVGGGIAGVTCAETLAFLAPTEKIILISQSPLVKRVTNLLAITQTLTQFDIEEKQSEYLSEKYQNLVVVHDSLKIINSDKNLILTDKNVEIKYQFLCICTGAKPKLITKDQNNDFILGIRDTDSIEYFIEKLKKARKIAIVGNGGIASELIYKISNLEIDWVIKDKHISATFFDPGAAEFFRASIDKTKIENDNVETKRVDNFDIKKAKKTNLNLTQNLDQSGPSKRLKYTEEEKEDKLASFKSGAALGPDWYKSLKICGNSVLPADVKVHYNCEIFNINISNINENKQKEDAYPVELQLSNGEKIYCDLVVSATGVTPNVSFVSTPALDICTENGIKVNEQMQTNIKNIFAAGDVCFPSWQHSKQWFCMKLWTQARQMGCYAAKTMYAHFQKEKEILQDFCFELFTHSTRLFGYKVVLIGLFNGQKLGKDYEILLRMTKGVEYVKFVLQNGKLQGAVLIGDTDLEETCENLILNEIDLSQYKEELLNPDIDIEDYFD